MLVKSGWTWLSGRLVPVIVLAVCVSPLLAQDDDRLTCSDECHAEAMEIYNGDTDPSDPEWQDANEFYEDCVEDCYA